MTQEILQALRNIEDKIMREPSSVLKAVTMTGVTSYAPRIHINGVAYDRVDGPKEPTSFIWTDAMYAVFKDRHTMSGLLAIWAATRDAAVYDTPKPINQITPEGDYYTRVGNAYSSKAPSDDGWIEWGGGDCPVEPGCVVSIRTGTDNSSEGSEDIADSWWWGRHSDGALDGSEITSYRIVSP